MRKTHRLLVASATAASFVGASFGAEPKPEVSKGFSCQAAAEGLGAIDRTDTQAAIMGLAKAIEICHNSAKADARISDAKSPHTIGVAVNTYDGGRVVFSEQFNQPPTSEREDFRNVVAIGATVLPKIVSGKELPAYNISFSRVEEENGTCWDAHWSGVAPEGRTALSVVNEEGGPVLPSPSGPISDPTIVGGAMQEMIGQFGGLLQHVGPHATTPKLPTPSY